MDFYFENEVIPGYRNSCWLHFCKGCTQPRPRPRACTVNSLRAGRLRWTFPVPSSRKGAKVRIIHRIQGGYHARPARQPAAHTRLLSQGKLNF